MNSTAVSILAVAVLIGGAVFFSRDGASVASASNVTVVDGKQIVEVSAKGGYSPRTSVAKAGVPTVLRFKTDGAYDCSTSVRIPSLNVSERLPATGVTDIDVGTPQVATLQGTCSMGMYSFEVNFQA